MLEVHNFTSIWLKISFSRSKATKWLKAISEIQHNQAQATTRTCLVNIWIMKNQDWPCLRQFIGKNEPMAPKHCDFKFHCYIHLQARNTLKPFITKNWKVYRQHWMSEIFLQEQQLPRLCDYLVVHNVTAILENNLFAIKHTVLIVKVFANANSKSIWARCVIIHIVFK